MVKPLGKDDPAKQRLRLPASQPYEVGYSKPPVATRFQPGKSGNPAGRRKGSKNKLPSLSEERIKRLIIEEAYRTIPIVEQGRRVSIPMITAVLRAVAMNAARGNNRAATLFTKLVEKTEAENKKHVGDTFRSMLDYRDLWNKELKRRKRLNLKLPDPIPHPDDIVINPRTMEVRIAGPMTQDEIPRYRFAAILLDAYEENIRENQAKLESAPEGPESVKLRLVISKDQELVRGLRQHYGPRSERVKDPIIREVEELVGLPFDLDDDEEEGT
jgi:uncharacterized protein DUF5681